MTIRTLTDKTGGLLNLEQHAVLIKWRRMVNIDLHVEFVLLLELLVGLVQLVDGCLQLHLKRVHLLPIVANASVSLAASFWSW